MESKIKEAAVNEQVIQNQPEQIENEGDIKDDSSR
jgi:hypothetical protein